MTQRTARRDDWPSLSVWGVVAILPLWAATAATLVKPLAPGLAAAPFAGRAYAALLLVLLAGSRWRERRAAAASRALHGEAALTLAFAVTAWASLLLPAVPGLSLLVTALLMQGLRDVIAVEDGRLPQSCGAGRLAMLAATVIPLLAELVAQLT